MHIKMTNQDIDQGFAQDSSWCPLAIAIMRETGADYVSIESADEIEIGFHPPFNASYKMLRPATKSDENVIAHFIRNMDSNHGLIVPVKFNLIENIPADEPLTREEWGELHTYEDGK